MEAITTRIKHLIQESGLTNSEFAKRLDVNPSIVSHILSGRNKVSLQVILQIKEAFPTVDVQELLVGTKSANKNMHKPTPITNVNSDAIQNIPQETVKESPSKPEKQTLAAPALSPTADKTIEKILILYTDKTMETYRP